VAVVRGSEVLAEREAEMRGRQEERLMPAVARTLDVAGVRVSELERIVCGAGPGSFTSLRIAAAIAKGIASGCGIPLFAVPSLALVVAAAGRDGRGPEPGRYVVVTDAMRGDMFAAAYEVADERITELEPARPLPGADAPLLARRLGARLIGPGQARDVAPRARGVALLAPGDGSALLREVSVVSWEPDYGRQAEAQAKWERTHGRPLPAS
jgi:tRNA threonylcarbamoyladenosine biosynthesis protein TsaB